MIGADFHHDRQLRRKRKRTPAPKAVSFSARRATLGLMLFAAFASVTASAFYRQVVETDFLKDEGAKRFLRDREIPARRGIIMDRNQEPLAISTSVSTIWADPQLLSARPDAFAALARALEEPEDEIAAKIRSYADKDRRYMYLKRRVEPHTARAVEDVIETYRLGGVGMDTEYRRFYPAGEIFGQLIGFTGIDDNGQEGIELVRNGTKSLEETRMDFFMDVDAFDAAAALAAVEKRTVHQVLNGEGDIRVGAHVGRILAAQFQAGIDELVGNTVLDAPARRYRSGEVDVANPGIPQQ